MLTASPVANVESPAPVTTSPASTPMRACELELVDALEDLERGTDGALRVVLVRLRDPERRHDGVARELLHRASVALDAARDAVEELRHAPAHDFRVARRDERRRVDEVDEQDRGEFSFHLLGLSVRTIRTAFTIPAVLDPKVFKAYDIRGIYPDEIDEDGAREIGRAYVEQFEPTTHRRRTRHAQLVAGHGEGGDRRRCGRGGRGDRHRARRHRDALFRGRRSRSRRRPPGDRVAQPQGVHGGQGRAPRRDARRRRLGPSGHPRPSPVPFSQARDRSQDRSGGGCLSGLRRQGPVLRRRGSDPEAARRDRRRERDGRRHDAAGPRADPDRRPSLLLRARRLVPEPRAEPAPAREPRVRDRQGARGQAPTSERPSTATPTAASSSTTPASSCPATS